MTLLEITQDILSDMDSDEVNSISDTQESLQVAQIVRSTYYNIVDGKDFPFLYEMFQLSTSGTTARPTHMSLPDTVADLKWIKYDNKENGGTKDLYQKIQYKHPEDFLDITDARDASDTKVTAIADTSSVTINIFNERGPQYFTSFDDEVLVFDAYDSAKETNLQNTSTQAYGKQSVTWSVTDTFTPDLPVQMFSYLLNEAKSACFVTLKQMPNAKVEQQAQTQKRRMSQDAWNMNKGITFGDYGRK